MIDHADWSFGRNEPVIQPAKLAQHPSGYFGGHYDQSLHLRPANTADCSAMMNARFRTLRPPRATAQRLDCGFRTAKARALWRNPNVGCRTQIPEPCTVAGTELRDESRGIHNELVARRAVVNH